MWPCDLLSQCFGVTGDFALAVYVCIDTRRSTDLGRYSVPPGYFFISILPFLVEIRAWHISSEYASLVLFRP